MNLIQQSVQQITRENLKNYYDTEQAEDELFNMLQSNRLYMMKDRTLDFIKQISGKSGDSYNIRETGKFLSDLIISKEYRNRFKELCNKNGLIMSVFVENAIRRFVDGR